MAVVGLFWRPHFLRWADACAFACGCWQELKLKGLQLGDELELATHTRAVWLFIGRNVSTEALDGRPEHTDRVVCDGTWHYQVEGCKEARRKHQGGTSEAPGKHQGGTRDAPGRHQGCTMEAPGRHQGGAKEAPGKCESLRGAPEQGSSAKKMPRGSFFTI